MRDTKKDRPIAKFFLIIFILAGFTLLSFPSNASILTYYRYHIIQKGESLWEIAKQYGTSVKEIKRKNNLHTDRIYPRQKLIIPIKIKGVYHQVKPHEYLWRICKTYEVNMEEVVYLNNISDPNHLVPGQKIFIPGASKVKQVEIPREKKDTSASPQQEVVKSFPSAEQPVKGKGFLVWPVKEDVAGYKRSTSGIDIFAPGGITVVAAASGKVEFSGELREFGNVMMKAIIIKHSELGLYTLYYYYMESSVNLVKKGDLVEQGESIAKMGIAGASKEIMLHFEVRRIKDVKSMDPLEYLPSNFE